ncbi:MAG: hypothetical protein QM730_04120 [Anaerolineales bacterium]
MGVKKESPSKDNVPFGVVLFVGMLLTCILANAISFPMQSGMFTSWKSLPALPSKAIHIVEVDPDHVWVETSNGDIYTAALMCKETENCNQWIEIVSPTEIMPLQYQPIKRGETCSSLDGNFSPSIPSKFEIKECILATAYGVPDPEWGYKTYFALMADGTVKYWRHGNGILGFFGSFIFSTVILPVLVAVVISMSYLIRNVLQRRKAG